MNAGLISSDFVFVNSAEFTKTLTTDVVDRIASVMRNNGWAMLQARVRGNTNQDDAPAKTYILGNKTPRLYRRTGALDRAMIRGQRGNIYDLRVDTRSVVVTYGIDTGVVPYAEIHEYGGTITQTVTPKQRRFFWAKYYETKEPKFRGMALASQLVIKIPARPYFRAGVQEFFDKDLGQLVALALRTS